MSTSLTLQTLPQTQFTHAKRVIIASNKGPIEYQLSADKTIKYIQDLGDIAVALTDLAKHIEVTWVALARTEGDRIVIREAQENDNLLLSPLTKVKMYLHYVAISKDAYRKHNEKICNQLLWFFQHYLYDPSDNAYSPERIQYEWQKGYCVANRAIADAVNVEIDRYDTTPVIMLHDYHLYLVPAMIRQRFPNIIIQQFIYIPWPDVRLWSLLPSNVAQAIFSGLTGNDIIGFQTERDARNFLEGARALLDGVVVDFEEGAIWWQGHRTQARAYPISISVTEERRVVQSRAGKRITEKILPLLGEKTIMRVDEIEPIKNIVRGFQAYAQMLDEHPEFQGQVKFLAFLIPSHQSLPVYKRYTIEVKKIIEDINHRYGTDTWMPIEAFISNNRTQALAAMQYYDVLLVNSIIEGMNLVAKEGPSVNLTNGVVVLSRTAGAFQQMGRATIPTSPTDVNETAQALYKALTLSSDERRMKATLARQIVERQDLSAWLQRQIKDLNNINHN